MNAYTQRRYKETQAEIDALQPLTTNMALSQMERSRAAYDLRRALDTRAELLAGDHWLDGFATQTVANAVTNALRNSGGKVMRS